jgi:hypothetical protein
MKGHMEEVLAASSSPSDVVPTQKSNLPFFV